MQVPTILCVVLLTVAALPIAAQLRQSFPDEAARELINAALLQYFDPASHFEVAVAGTTISGNVLSLDEISIVGDPAVVRGFSGHLTAHITGLQVDMASVTTGQIRVLRVSKATVVARSTARAVEEGVVKTLSTIQGPRIRISGGQFEARATVKRWDRTYRAQVTGTLVVEAKRRVWVRILGVQVDGGDAPPSLIERELAKINPILDLSNWPLNLSIQRLTLHNDTIQLLATHVP